MEQTLRAVIEPLAALERGAGSPGERQAADMLAGMFRDAGADSVRIDEETFRGESYARVLLPLGLAGFAGSLVVRRHPLLGATLAALAAAATVDEAENGRRWWRKAAFGEQTTWNVVAECGDPGADRTLVVLAHHDAAATGAMFDQSLQKWLARRFPDIVARTDTALPIWWPVVAGPLATIASALTGSRRLARAGRALGAVTIAAAADIARHRIVPGANDNLSACAAQVALAERLRAEPVTGIRVVLASCGAEEVLQGGIYGFVERHLAACDPASTWVLNLDTIASPQLILLEGEGPFRMHDYTDSSFRDRVAAVAERATGEPLRRGCRARASTDAIIPSRAGFPTTSISSWEPDTKLLSNYHLMSDTAENADYASVERAVVIAEALARELAA